MTGNSSYIAKLCMAFVGAGCLTAFSSCSANYAGIALTIQGIKADIVRLEVIPSVNDRILSTEVFSDLDGSTEYVAGFQLPVSYLGQSVSFRVNAVNATNCVSLTGSYGAQTDTARRYDLRVELGLANGDKIDGNIFDIHGSSPNDIWTVGGPGGVAHWDGCSWKNVPGPADTSGLIKVYVPPPTPTKRTVYAISTSKIYKYDGTAWSVDHDPMFTTSVPNVEMVLTGIAGNFDSDVWVIASNKSPTWTANAGNNSLILRRNASSWSSDTSSNVATYLKNNIKSLHVVNQTNLIIAGQDPSSSWFVARWQVGAWQNQAISQPIAANTPTAVWGASVDDYLVGGVPRLMRRFLTGSAAPETQFEALFPIGTGNPDWRPGRIHGVSNNDIWVLNFATAPKLQSRISRYVNNQWKIESDIDNIGAQITSLYVAGKDDVWFVGYSGARIHYDGKGYKKIENPMP